MPIGLNMGAGTARSMGISVSMNPSPVLLVAQFNKLGADIRSFKEPLTRAVKQVVSPSLQQNFLSQGRPDVWPELAEATYYRKQRDGYSSVANFPLIRTKRLFNRAGSFSIWKIDGRDGTASIDLPNDVWYGKVHQEGAGLTFDMGGGGVHRHKNRRTGMIVETTFGEVGSVPQRMWALLQEKDIDDIEKVFQKWLKERLRAAGFRGDVL